MADFRWTSKRQQVALILSQGYTNAEAAERAGVGERTIYRWRKSVEFEAEIDRLTLLTGISQRSERLRIAMRVIRQKVGDEVQTVKDLLEWLKFIQSETDGAKLDLTSLFADMETAASNAEAGATEKPLADAVP